MTSAMMSDVGIQRNCQAGTIMSA